MKNNAALLTLTLTGCLLPAGTDAVGSVENAAIIDGANWNLLLSFESDPVHRVGALYGRAVGAIGGCGGFLIDDDVFVTARHCRTTPQRTVHFGHFGGDGDDDLFFDAQLEAVARAKAIGVKDPNIADLRDFTCDLIGQEALNHDIDYYRCQPNTVVWNEFGIPFGPTLVYRLKPGHVWGHYNVQTGHRAANTPLHQEVIDRRCGDTVSSVLLAPGKMIDVTNACSDSFAGCFELSSDNTKGSSGGVIVDRNTNRAFGVVQSTTFLTEDPADPCASVPQWTVANRGSYMGSRANTLVAADPGGDGQDVGAFTKADYGWVGTLGAVATLDCPPRMLAAGIVSTAASDGSIGDFGLVCIPSRSDDGIAHRLDRATVIAGGSTDVGVGSIVNMDLNTFLHEKLSTTESSPGVHGHQMCPPGTYLTSVEGRGDSDVNRITAIRCTVPLTGQVVSRAFWPNIDSSYGWDGGGTSQETVCAPGAYAAGLRITAAPDTKGFRIRCRYQTP